MIKTHFNKDEGVLYAKTTGEITVDQMVEAHNKTLMNDELPRNLRILEDATAAEINLTMPDVNQIKKLVEKNAGRYKFVKHAVVLNNPKGAAYGMWFDEHIQHLNYKLKMFHSIDAAQEWLKL